MSASETKTIDARRTTCSGCGTEGVRVDTDAGEIIEGGAVLAEVEGETLLLCGRSDGSDLHLTLCEGCAAADKPSVDVELDSPVGPRALVVGKLSHDEIEAEIPAGWTVSWGSEVATSRRWTDAQGNEFAVFSYALVRS